MEEEAPAEEKIQLESANDEELKAMFDEDDDGGDKAEEEEDTVDGPTSQAYFLQVPYFDERTT